MVHQLTLSSDAFPQFLGVLGLRFVGLEVVDMNVTGICQLVTCSPRIDLTYKPPCLPLSKGSMNFSYASLSFPD